MTYIHIDLPFRSSPAIFNGVHVARSLVVCVARSLVVCVARSLVVCVARSLVVCVARSLVVCVARSLVFCVVFCGSLFSWQVCFISKGLVSV